MFFNRTFRIFSSPSATEHNAGRFQAEKLSFCRVLCLTKPVVNPMWHFGSIYVKESKHPYRDASNLRRESKRQKQTIKLLTNNNLSVALRNGGFASVTLLIIPYTQLVHVLM